MSNFSFIMLVAGSVFVALLVIGIILASLYKRATKEQSFVRTGMGGQKIIMNGGSLVLPVLHETIPVNMNTLRLAVSRKEGQALITKDRMRVDVLAEFYLRVKPDAEAIAYAAQTLGLRTLDPGALKEMIEGKFVDALRSVAAEMEMADLHEQRSQFVQKVQQVVSEDLLKNGLELESVSLTGLDQTHREFFSQDNVFDAEGLARMTRSIEARRKEVNDIEQETSVEIEKKNLNAEQQQLEIRREKRYAQLQQEREIAIREAAQNTEVAKERAQREQEAQQAEIESQRDIDNARISAEQTTKLADMEKERRIREEAIEQERTLEQQNIQKRKALEIAEQERAIAIAEKSKEQSLADQQANDARAEAVRAEERVTTAKDVEVAEREKAIEIIEAQKEAERQATGIKVAAEAEKMAADDLAESLRLKATAEADAIRIKAQADAEKYKVDAEGQRLLNEAMNMLSEQQIELKKTLSLHERLPGIIAESVRPMQQIEGMKIISIDGLNGVAGNKGSGVLNGDTAESSSSLPEALVNGALKHRAMAPLVDNLLKEAGVSDLASLMNGDVNQNTQ